jgi:hypothetical protein
MVFVFHNYGTKILLFISAITVWSCTLYFTLHLQDLWRGKNPWNKPTSFIQNPTNSPIQNSTLNGPGLLWCEKRRPMDFMAEPSNAISNFAYLLVGILMVHVSIYDYFFNDDPHRSKHSLMIQHPAWSLNYGLSTMLLGVCSFLMHASNLPRHTHWDISSMYACVAFPIWYIIFQYIHWIPFSQEVLLGLHWIETGYFFLFKLPFNSTQILIFTLLMILMLTILTYFINRSSRILHVNYFSAAFVSLAVGYGVWNLEKIPGYCDPDSLYQLHALWHCFTALAIYFIYMYLATEVEKETDNSDNNLIQITVDNNNAQISA